MKKHKQIEIPDQYLTNDITELKRAALVNRDVNLLKGLKKNHDTSKAWKTYYVRFNEVVIRDKQGEIIPFKSLPFDRDEIGFHILSIDANYLILTKEAFQDKPGDIYRHLTSDFEGAHDCKCWIKEVPPETSFPIPDDYNHNQVCIDYVNKVCVQKGDFQRIFEKSDDRLTPYSWRKNTTRYHYVDQWGNSIISHLKPEEGTPFTTDEVKPIDGVRKQ